MQGTVRALFVTPEKKAKPVSLNSVETIDRGFDGDFHAKVANRRQILIMSGSVLDDLRLEPGAVFENVVVDGLDVMSFAEGQQLRMGEALLEVTIPCEPCGMMDRIRYGLRETLQGRRGVFARVITKGTVHVGDSVILCPKSVAENSLV